MDATTTTGAPAGRETVEAVLADPTLIRPVFQPIVDLRRSAVQGYEMLARLANDPSGTPPRWLAAAERHGLANALEATSSPPASPRASTCRAAPTSRINVSPGALVSSEVRAVLDAAPGGLEQLVFELTEQNGVDDYDGLATALDGARAAGGARGGRRRRAPATTSLQHVLRLRPEYVKLDRGLITDAHADPAKLAIIEAVGLFAGRLGAELVAPGIERRAEQEMLAGLAVPLGQGFLFGRPGPSLVRDVPIAGVRAVNGRPRAGCSTDRSRRRSTPACSPPGPSPPPARAGRSSSSSTATPARSACSCPRAAAGPIASGRSRPASRSRRSPSPAARSRARPPPVWTRSARACPTAASPGWSGSSASWAVTGAHRTRRSCFLPVSDAQAQARSRDPSIRRVMTG